MDDDNNTSNYALLEEIVRRLSRNNFFSDEQSVSQLLNNQLRWSLQQAFRGSNSPTNSLEALARQVPSASPHSAYFNREFVRGLLNAQLQLQQPFQNVYNAADLLDAATLAGHGLGRQPQYLVDDNSLASRHLLDSIRNGLQNEIGDQHISRRQPVFQVDLTNFFPGFRSRHDFFQQQNLLSIPFAPREVQSARVSSNMDALLLPHSPLSPGVEGRVSSEGPTDEATEAPHSVASRSVADNPKNQLVPATTTTAASTAFYEEAKDEKKQHHDYLDHATKGFKRKRPTSDPAPGSENLGSSSKRHQPQKPCSDRRPYNCVSFAQKLFRMVTEEEASGKKDVVEFLDRGGGFWLHDPRGIPELMLRYNFRGSKFSGFRRQLTSYGFRVEKEEGPEKGGFKNPLFSRGRPDLCYKIIRDEGKDGGSDK